MSRSAWAGVLSSSLNNARYIAIRRPSRQSETAMLLIVRTLRRRLRKLFLRINDRFRNMAGPPQSYAFIEAITVARCTGRANGADSVQFSFCLAESLIIAAPNFHSLGVSRLCVFVVNEVCASRIDPAGGAPRG